MNNDNKAYNTNGTLVNKSTFQKYLKSGKARQSKAEHKKKEKKTGYSLNHLKQFLFHSTETKSSPQKKKTFVFFGIFHLADTSLELYL